MGLQSFKIIKLKKLNWFTITYYSKIKMGLQLFIIKLKNVMGSQLFKIKFKK